MMLPLVIAVMPEGVDRDYMEWLFVEHHRLMMVTAFGIVPQSADADEIVSDSLIALYKKIDKLRGMGKMRCVCTSFRQFETRRSTT